MFFYETNNNNNNFFAIVPIVQNNRIIFHWMLLINSRPNIGVFTYMNAHIDFEQRYGYSIYPHKSSKQYTLVQYRLCVHVIPNYNTVFIPHHHPWYGTALHINRNLTCALTKVNIGNSIRSAHPYRHLYRRSTNASLFKSILPQWDFL